MRSSLKYFGYTIMRENYYSGSNQIIVIIFEQQIILPECLALTGVIWVPVPSEFLLQSSRQPLDHFLNLSRIQLLPLFNEPLQEENDGSNFFLHVSHSAS